MTRTLTRKENPLSICSSAALTAFVLQLALACPLTPAADESLLPRVFGIEPVNYEKDDDWRDFGEWALCARGTDLVFARGRRGLQKAPLPRRDEPLAQTRRTSVFLFVRDGAAIRLHVDRVARGDEKELAAINDSYLTADRSVSPPRVVLTKTPTKASYWILSGLKFDGDGYDCYISNKTEAGKVEWLSLGEKMTTHMNGAQSRPASLSSEKKTLFFLGDAQSGK